MPRAPRNPFPPRSFGELQQVSAHCWLYRSTVNSTVVVGNDAIAVIDSQVNQRSAERLRDAIASRFRQPIRWLINTHYHWDHCAGNACFAEAGATLLCNADTARFLIERQPRQKAFLTSRGFQLGPDPRIPSERIEDHPSIDLGGCRITLSRGLPAETPDPTLVAVPNDQVLICGDSLMGGSFPIFGQPVQREGLEDATWLQALEQLRAFQPRHICTGHGPLATPADIDRFAAICSWFLESVTACHGRGLSLNETIATVEATQPDWMAAMPIVWGTPRYAVLRVWAGLEDLGQPGWQHCKPSAIPRNPTAAETIAAELPEDNVSAWQHPIDQLLGDGDLGTAISLFELAIAIHPQAAHLTCQYGDSLMQASRSISSVLEKGDCFQAALQAWKQALTSDPDYGPAHLAIARFLSHMTYRNGDAPQAALAACSAAEHHNPPGRSQAECAFLRGLLHRSAHDESAATRAFQEALAMDPAFGPARLALLPC